MDVELLQSIEHYIAQHPGLRLVATEEGDHLCKQVAARFNFPEGRNWWWDSLPQGTFSCAYSGDESFDKLRELLPNGSVPMFMFVTDDEPPPWQGIAGGKDDLIELLREQRFFEYWIAGGEGRWIVFDTHHNTLLAAGDGLRTRSK